MAKLLIMHSHMLFCFMNGTLMGQGFFTRLLRQRTLLNRSGGVHYNLSEPESIDLLELIRTKNHLMEQSHGGVVSDSGFFYMDHFPLSIKSM